MVAAGQELWAMGGWDSAQFQDAVEIFDVRANAWRAGVRMKTAHAYFLAGHLNGEMYAAAGMVERQVHSRTHTELTLNLGLHLQHDISDCILTHKHSHVMQCDSF